MNSTCKNCHKKGLWRKTPYTEVHEGQRVRVWQCRCGQKQAGYVYPQGVKPKVWYFDIETALMTVSTFSLFVRHQYLPASTIVQNSFIICWSGCWVDDTQNWQYIWSECVNQDEALRNDDSRILRNLWSMMDSADYWVAHNGDKFDVKKSNYRFKMNGLGLPYMAKQLDTLKMARKYYASDSNALDYWAKKLGYGGKHEMEQEDWEKIRATGDPESLLKMEMYNRQDVRAGVNVYLDFLHDIEASGRQLVK